MAAVSEGDSAGQGPRVAAEGPEREIMKLYVTRHGQTQWNALDKVLGRTDVPLDETGRTQAEELARALTGEPIDLVLTSPLQRTAQTGAAVARSLGIPAQTADELIEMNFGIYEGVLRSDPVYQTAKARYFARYPEGESFLDVAARVYPFLRALPETVNEILLREQAVGGSSHDAEDEVVVTASALTDPGAETSAVPGAAFRPARGVLLVTHNGICRVIHSWFESMTNDEFRTFALPNCALMQYEL